MKHLEDLKLKFLFKKNNHFLATLLYKVKWSYEPSIPTACASTNEIKINEDFFKGLDEEVQLSVMAHELLHIVFKHHIRQGKRDGEIWNSAGDYLINYNLYKMGYAFPHDKWLFNQTLNDSYTTEEIYDLLLDDQKDEEPQYKLSNIPDTVTTVDSKEVDQEDIQVTAMVTEAKNMSDKMSGTLPNSIVVTIEKYLKTTIKWEVLLHRYFNSFCKDDYNYTKRNRRFRNVYMPSLDGVKLGCINTYIDTSCSVTQEQFAKQYAEMKKIKQLVMPKKMQIIDFDTTIKKVHKFDEYQAITNVELKGRGGTLLTEVAAHIIKDKPDISVIFTDGYVNTECIEALKKLNIIWCIIENKDFKSKNHKVIHIN